MKILGLKFWKRVNFNAFFRPSNLKTERFSTKLRVGYVYIEESLDTIFNMGYGGGAYDAKWPMAERVKDLNVFGQNVFFDVKIRICNYKDY